MNDLLKNLAPTVASALLGPLGGVAVSAIGNILGVSDATVDKVSKVFENGQITPDQVADIKKLELQYKNDEEERGFKYADLEFKDRESARRMAVDGGIANKLFVMSVIILVLCLGSEILVLFRGYPEKIPELVVGRVLGLLDAVALMVLSYYYGKTEGSQVIQKERRASDPTPK